MTMTPEKIAEGIDYAQFESAIGLNWYEVDPNLQFQVRRLVDRDQQPFVEKHLRRMGELCGGPIARRAEVTDKHPPQLVRYDEWGNEVCRIVHHPGAIETKRDLWENGFIGLRWSEEGRKYGSLHHVLTTGFSYLLSQAETGMLCAIGMTSSAAGIIERHAPARVRERFLPHMTTMNFDEAWDGAMFMTEIRGGSDLALSETTATWDEATGRWKLNGSKWFCSNVDAAAILTLARPEGAPDGLRGLALFLVPAFREDGSRNGIVIKRLKDKLGTRAVPTAEVDFVDAEAYLMAGESQNGTAARDGRGLNRMMEMVNGSRFGVAVMGLGIMRRSFLEAAIYASHREAFGQRIIDLPLVRETLTSMAVELEAAATLVFEAGEAGQRARESDQQRRLSRIAIPLAKFRCARKGVELASQAVEIFGGNGYIENWPVARQLRDAQCHTIWEGTENIICLDVLRSMRKEGAHEALLKRVYDIADSVEHPMLVDSAQVVRQSADEVRQAIQYLDQQSMDVQQLNARKLSNYLADVLSASLLLEEAGWELAYEGSARKALVARAYAAAHLAQQPLRGIASGDRTALDDFDAIVRYKPVGV